MTTAIIIFILIILLSITFAIIYSFVFNKPSKPEYYTPKKEVDEIKTIDENIEIVNEQIKKNSEMDGKNETDSDLINSFKDIKL